MSSQRSNSNDNVNRTNRPPHLQVSETEISEILAEYDHKLRKLDSDIELMRLFCYPYFKTSRYIIWRLLLRRRERAIDERDDFLKRTGIGLVHEHLREQGIDGDIKKRRLESWLKDNQVPYHGSELHQKRMRELQQRRDQKRIRYKELEEESFWRGKHNAPVQGPCSSQGENQSTNVNQIAQYDQWGNRPTRFSEQHTKLHKRDAGTYIGNEESNDRSKRTKYNLRKEIRSPLSTLQNVLMN